MQTRRGFLGLLAAGLALDPERLLWRPGAKLISVPAPPRPPRERLWTGDLLLINGRTHVVSHASEPSEFIDMLVSVHPAIRTSEGGFARVSESFALRARDAYANHMRGLGITPAMAARLFEI